METNSGTSNNSASGIVARRALKTAKIYNQCWQGFLDFIGQDEEGHVPDEEDYTNFFEHLRAGKRYKGSSMWAVYSRLNFMHQSKYGQRLQTWPRLSALVKSYGIGERRQKSNIFTEQQLETFLSDKNDDRSYWLVRKAFVVLAYLGGLRMPELHALKLEDLHPTTEGYYVNYQNSRYLVPKSTTSFSWASVIERYLFRLQRDTKDTTGPLFRTVRLHGTLTRGSIGLNTLYEIGKEVATVLELPQPELYIGRCFRRAADNEAEMMTTHFVEKKKQTDDHVKESTAVHTKKLPQNKDDPDPNAALTNDKQATGAIPHISVPYPPQIQDQVQDNSDDDDAGDPLCLSGDSLKTEPAADSSSGQVQAPPASANIVLTGFKRKRNFLEFAEEVSVDLQVGAKKSCPSSSSSSSSLSESATSPAVCQTEEERLHYVIIGLKRVISSLTDENSALKKQVKNLTSVTEKDKEISESEKYAVLKEKLGEHLTPTQIACFYYGGDWKNCVWDKEDLTRAFTLRQLGMSRQAYSHLRAKRILPLPSLSTLKDAKTVLSNTKNKNGQ